MNKIYYLRVFLKYTLLLPFLIGISILCFFYRFLCLIIECIFWVMDGTIEFKELSGLIFDLKDIWEIPKN